MSYPARTFHRKPPPSKAALRIDAQMVVLQRVSRGIDTPPHMLVSIARSHGMSVAEIEQMIAAEIARQAK